MSMIGEYARFTPAELDRAVRDPAWAWEFVEELLYAPEDGTAPLQGPPRGRLHDTGKMWHALEFLLDRHHVPVNVVHGERELSGAEDWGYGPPRLIVPERVRTAAEAMAAITPEGLIAGTTPADLAAAGIYTFEGGGDETLDDAAHAYQRLAAFFTATARLRHGLLVWID
ncbi:YfbM family protein [Streptomyces sp. NPDC000594]|uniref:YfbM family protein n=1 Tax=Streptomyces sp. NPDC000594 TaxID=3154261 RepID=UPI00332F3130